MTGSGGTAEVALALAGTAGRATESFGSWCVDVDPAGWPATARTGRDRFGLQYLDWLGGVDEGAAGFAVVAHVLDPIRMVHLLLRTVLSREEPTVASITAVYAGASWHEREAAEMFGIRFDDHPDPAGLLLSASITGHPLRKDFVLRARVDTAWPGAPEPGESSAGSANGPHGSTRRPRRRARPLGVPDDGPDGTGTTGG